MKQNTIETHQDDLNLDPIIVKKKTNIFIILGLFLIAVLSYCALVGKMDTSRFWHSYLFSIVFFISISLGAMFFVLMQHLSFAGWSVVVRRIAEVFSKSIWLPLVFLVPIIISLLLHDHSLFHWLGADDDVIIEKKQPYLNVTFFIIRTIIYALIFLIISRFLYRQSFLQDFTGIKSTTLSLEKNSTYMTFFYAIGVTFFAFDYIMSLNPHWYSTILGVYFFAGSLVAAIALIGIVARLLQKLGYLKNIINIEHYHDIGKLLFGFNVFWSYIAFSQYFIIWYGNIPEEIAWYQDREKGIWLYITLLLVIGHVVIPLVLFMSKYVKRSKKYSMWMYIWLVFMHIVDIYYLVMPSWLHHSYALDFQIEITDGVMFFGFLLLYASIFMRILSQARLIPVKDPRLVESLKFENF